jgi:hypothetical protein
MLQRTENILNSYKKKTTSLDISDEKLYGILDLSRFKNLEYLFCNNKKISKIINIPETLIELNFTEDKETSVEGYISYVRLDDNNYLDSISEIKNKSITLVIDGDLFSYYKKINVIPNFIKKLIIKNYFDYNNIPNEIINSSITNLTIDTGLINNDLIKNFINNLPDKITELTFNYGSFNLELLNNLPSKLHKLTLINCYIRNNNLLNNLPSKLHNLTFIDCKFYDTNMSNLPNSIQCLKFDNCAFNRTTNIITNLMQNIPENVKHLTITVDLNYFDFDLNYYNIPNIDFIGLIHLLPNTLKYLEIGNGNIYNIRDINEPIIKLPDDLEILKINGRLKSEEQNFLKLPKNLKYIKNNDYTYRIKDVNIKDENGKYIIKNIKGINKIYKIKNIIDLEFIINKYIYNNCLKKTNTNIGDYFFNTKNNFKDLTFEDLKKINLLKENLQNVSFQKYLVNNNHTYSLIPSNNNIDKVLGCEDLQYLINSFL